MIWLFYAALAGRWFVTDGDAIYPKALPLG